jgi:hypothetical protein
MIMSRLEAGGPEDHEAGLEAPAVRQD